MDEFFLPYDLRSESYSTVFLISQVYWKDANYRSVPSKKKKILRENDKKYYFELFAVKYILNFFKIHLITELFIFGVSFIS